MYAWKDEEFKLHLTVADLAKLARLPANVGEFYISAVTALPSEKCSTEKDDRDDTVYSIVFSRTQSHKLKGN